MEYKMTEKTFTKEEQANHCDSLIELLGTIPNKQYDHAIHTIADINNKDSRTCALGWAASYGIGGLEFKYMKPAHPDIDCPFTSIFAAEHVFGVSSYQHVFAVWKPRDNNEKNMTEKQLVINRLKQLSTSLRKGSKLRLIN